MVRGLRHGKFGTQLEIRRADGSSKMVTNIYQKQIDVNDFGNKVKTAPKKSTKDESKAIMAEELLIGNATMDDKDKQLLSMLHTHLIDLIENSYNSLCEELFQQMLPQQALLEESDVFHFFKFQGFILECVRLKAQKEHQQAQKNAGASKSKPVPF